MAKLYALKGDFMLVFEVIDMFIYNRQNGLAGSKGKAAVRTIITYKYALRPFHEFMESRDKLVFKDITASDVRAYVEHINDKLTTGKWSKSRFLSTVKVLKAFYRFIEDDDECAEAGLKSHRKKLPVAGQFPRRDNIPSPQDLKKWKNAFNLSTILGMRNWIMFCTLLETGVRRAELASLKIAYVQLDNHTIYVPDGKTGSRTIAITEILARNIRAFLKKRSKTVFADSEYLFSSYKSEVPNGEMVTRVFEKMRKDHNLPYVTPHTMRHAFCTYYLSNGGSTERLRNMTGHKTYTAMLHYMHLAKVSGDGQKEELERVSPLRMLDKV
jgi:site-specific recombinase XerD